ncbi:MAG: dihydroxyacetone kinase subunit L [Acidobacteria bacterium]|nr:MAG: dihydroxyacetone kinase subunit L [Acidobacteriota bacterium]
MNQATITARDLRQMLAFVGDAITNEEARLNALDAAIGDGDHGITMRVGFNAIHTRVSGLPTAAGIDAVLREAGMAFMGATGGAIGVLFGKMLMAAGAALEGHLEIAPAEFKVLLDSMETALATAGKAKAGDKTMLDPVHAAHQAVLELGNSRPELAVLLAHASQAARIAAESTAGMPARAGRASRLGDRALGHPDPGAVSFSIVLGAMAEWMQRNALRTR